MVSASWAALHGELGLAQAREAGVSSVKALPQSILFHHPSPILSLGVCEKVCVLCVCVRVYV